MGDDIVARTSGPEEVAAILKGAWPGRYIVEEWSMAGKTLASGYTSQSWGIAIRKADGTVDVEQEPAPLKR
jgi:hypothetical protein